MESDSSIRFSPSKLDTYKDCPRRYQFRYVDGIKRDTRSVEAYLGTCVHAALEKLYEGITHGKLLSAAAVVKAFEDEWDAGWSDQIVIRGKDYSAKDWKALGADCARSYYKAHAPFDRDRTVGIEKRVGFPLEAEGKVYRIEGFVDRLSLAPDGAFEIHDYKTGKNLPTQEDVDGDWQLALYDAAVRHAWPDAPAVRLVWHYLRPGKELRSFRTPEQLESLKAEVAALIGRIKRDHEFAPRKSALCDWCEYRDICPLWSHAESLAAMPAAQRKHEEGAKLVDQYAALELKKRELREELRRLEKEQEGLAPGIFRYAEGRGVTVVSGLEGEVEVVVKDELRWPTKTGAPEEFEALERELRQSALWPEVSHLDSHRLTDGIRKKAWAGELLSLVESLIKRYARRASEKGLRFRRKKEAEDD